LSEQESKRAVSLSGAPIFRRTPVRAASSDSRRRKFVGQRHLVADVGEVVKPTLTAFTAL